MGFYNDFAVTNPSGWHTFDAIVLTLLPSGVRYEIVGQTVDGSLVDILRGNNVLANDLLVHRNGRVGSMDVTKDTILAPITDLVRLPDDLQAALLPYEQVPGGHRV